jgi:hypothetical protein
VDYDFAIGVEFPDAPLHVAQRDQVAANLGNLGFEGLADIEQEKVFAGVALFLELGGGDLGDSVLQLCHPGAFDGCWFRDNAAELVVVDQLRNGGVRAADGAVGILAELEFAEAHAQRVDQQQAADEGLALAEDKLDDLGGLDDADKAGEYAKHSTLGAGGHEARRRRLRIEAAVAGAILGGEDAGLALEAEDRSVGIGLVAAEHAGVVHEVAGLEVVSAVSDDVEVADDLHRVGAGEHGVVLHDGHEGVERLQLLFGRVELGPAYIFGAVNDLALQIAEVDHVEVDEAQSADARGGEVKGEGRAEASGAHAEHFGGFELLLALHAHFGEDKVAGVALDLVVGQGWQGCRFFSQCWHRPSAS